MPVRLGRTDRSARGWASLAWLQGGAGQARGRLPVQCSSAFGPSGRVLAGRVVMGRRPLVGRTGHRPLPTRLGIGSSQVAVAADGVEDDTQDDEIDLLGAWWMCDDPLPNLPAITYRLVSDADSSEEPAHSSEEAEQQRHDHEEANKSLRSEHSVCRRSAAEEEWQAAEADLQRALNALKLMAHDVQPSDGVQLRSERSEGATPRWMDEMGTGGCAAIACYLGPADRQAARTACRTLDDRHSGRPGADPQLFEEKHSGPARHSGGELEHADQQEVQKPDADQARHYGDDRSCVMLLEGAGQQLVEGKPLDVQQPSDGEIMGVDRLYVKGSSTDRHSAAAGKLEGKAMNANAAVFVPAGGAGLTLWTVLRVGAPWCEMDMDESVHGMEFSEEPHADQQRVEGYPFEEERNGRQQSEGEHCADQRLEVSRALREVRRRLRVLCEGGATRSGDPRVPELRALRGRLCAQLAQTASAGQGGPPAGSDASAPKRRRGRH